MSIHIPRPLWQSTPVISSREVGISSLASSSSSSTHRPLAGGSYGFDRGIDDDDNNQKNGFRYTLLSSEPAHKEGQNGKYELDQDLIELVQLARSLTVPATFAASAGQAWRSDSEALLALQKWRDTTVPDTLVGIQKRLERLQQTDSIQAAENKDKDRDGGLADRQIQIQRALVVVICIVARFVPATLESATSKLNSAAHVAGGREDANRAKLVENGNGFEPESEPDDQDWTTSECAGLANAVLDQALSCSAELALAEGQRRLATCLLVDYVKPVFSAATTTPASSVDPASGRRRPPASGSTLVSSLDQSLGNHRVSYPSLSIQGGADDDDECANPTAKQNAWKGSSSIFSQPSTATPVAADTIPTAVRSEALGSVNVLAYCIGMLSRTVESQRDWESVWPLFLPPMLTVLEDVEPRYRVQGAAIAHRLLSCCLPAQEQEQEQEPKRDNLASSADRGIPGSLLVKTGVGALLEQTLHVNLTYVHDEQHGPALLHHSIGALRGLVLRTTCPLLSRSHPVASEIQTALPRAFPSCLGTTTQQSQQQDCGKRRFDALSSLVSEGVLSTWSYLPLPPTAVVSAQKFAVVTCTWFAILMRDLVPRSRDIVGGNGGDAGVSAGIRFLEASLEWMFTAWIANLSLLTTREITSTIILLQTLHTVISACSSPHSQPPKSLGMLVSRIISSIAKAWIVTQDTAETLAATLSDLPSHDMRHIERLQTELQRLTALLLDLQPAWRSRFQDLVAVDVRINQLLPPI
ncbi:hypothetical protein BCV70DRAFT_237126 [Testicularia cyperi]|uniref:Uncharacterized protein n=1 Tax=Testicularia cyperi TaxID=1882483 RepID=A0A317XRC0_9BASI|nr:hypothetical protein BCV70DRAFT_237126 [Testicularia cyperi]